MESFLFDENFLAQEELRELKNLIGFESINQNYVKSHFYNNKEKTLVIDQHIRSSEKIQFRDEKIFDWFEENVINKLNSSYPHLYFVLFRDDIELIRYQENDFFKRHVDTINFYSNEFINYTCLINLQSCQSGGETVIYDDNNEPNEFKETGQKEGSILLFQKQLQHEGKTVLKGEKIIMVANIVVFKKEQKDDDVIIINIENTKNSYVIPIRHLREVQTESKNSRSLQNFKDTVYYSYYNFQKNINPNQKIFRYTESFLTNNEFLVFYNLVYPPNNLNNLNVLDYIGVGKSDIYKDFNTFVNTGYVKNNFITETHFIDYDYNYNRNSDKDSWDCISDSQDPNDVEVEEKENNEDSNGRDLEEDSDSSDLEEDADSSDLEEDDIEELIEHQDSNNSDSEENNIEDPYQSNIDYSQYCFDTTSGNTSESNYSSESDIEESIEHEDFNSSDLEENDIEKSIECNNSKENNIKIGRRYKITPNDIFMCHMDDYYHLIKLIDNEDIIPFQLITFENNNNADEWYYGYNKNSIVVWFGIYDNLFVTCDYNFYRIPSDRHNYNDNEQSDDERSDDSDGHNDSDGNFVSLPLNELNYKAASLKIMDAKQFDIYGGYNKKYDTKIINEIIFEHNKFRKMGDITFSDSADPYIAINKYITKIMKDIESIGSRGDGYSGKNSYITDQMQLDPLYKLKNYEKVCDSKINNLNIQSLENLDLVGLMKRIQCLNVVSDIKRSNTSKDLTCNSVQYTIYDVVFKFGFIHRDKIKPKI